jgi:hypothetical protein
MIFNKNVLFATFLTSKILDHYITLDSVRGIWIIYIFLIPFKNVHHRKYLKFNTFIYILPSLIFCLI